MTTASALSHVHCAAGRFPPMATLTTWFSHRKLLNAKPDESKKSLICPVTLKCNEWWISASAAGVNRGANAVLSSRKCQSAVSPHRCHTASVHVLVTITLLPSAFKDSVCKNFHSEQLVNFGGCLGPARVLGPAPNVRFPFLSPLETEKKKPIMYYFCYAAAAVRRLHNIMRSTLGLQRALFFFLFFFGCHPNFAK